MNHAAKKIKAADDEDDVLFDRAVDFLRGQIPITRKEWEDLHIDPKVRLRAFCVANQTKADYVYLIRQQLIDAVEKGKGISESWSDLKNLIDTDNIEPIRPGYWETVYRTNMNTAYTAGKLMEFEETKPVAIQLFFINDDRQSHICHELFQDTDGLALPVDHPFWNKYGYPPYHFNCRTTFRGIYSNLVAKDVIVEDPPMKRFRKFSPEEGFGGNPLDKESWWRLTENMAIRAAQFNMFNDVEGMAKANGLHNFTLDLVNGSNTQELYGTKFKAEKAVAAKPLQKEVAFAKELIDRHHSVYFTPQNAKLKSKNPEGIIDGKLAEMKILTSPNITKLAVRIQECEDQKANLACIRITNTSGYTQADAERVARATLTTGYSYQAGLKTKTVKTENVSEIFLLYGNSFVIIKK